MINKSISFGKQIPYIKCNVQERLSKKFEPATFYELDCKNISDYETVRKAKGNWKFMHYFLPNIRNKMLINNIPGINTSDNFYILKTDSDDKLIGIVQTKNKDNNISIKFIESQSEGKYKYAGQNMVASLAKKLIKDDGKAIFVDAPLTSALPFYIGQCGFQIHDYGKLILPIQKAGNFIKQLEEDTETRLIDLQG